MGLGDGQLASVLAFYLLWQIRLKSSKVFLQNCMLKRMKINKKEARVAKQ